MIITRSWLGQAITLDRQALDAWTAGNGWLWVHLHRTHEETGQWLREKAGWMADEMNNNRYILRMLWKSAAGQS